MKDVESVDSARRAATLVGHPVRTRILKIARSPISASDLARRLGQPRQRVNYHVRMLARDGFLEPATQQKKRNMLEQQYVASAIAYVITPAVLGEVAPRFVGARDEASAAHLLGLCAQAQGELTDVMATANAAGVRLRTLSKQSEMRFENAAQRAEFTRELSAALNAVIERHALPFADDYGQPAPGRPFRLIVGLYPLLEGTSGP